MGERSGVGLVECTILEALDSLGAQPGRRHRNNARVLAAVEDRIGLAPGYAYEVLLDLARPWTMPVSLIDGQGNFGSRGNDAAANPPYVAGVNRRSSVLASAGLARCATSYVTGSAADRCRRAFRPGPVRAQTGPLEGCDRGW